MYAPRRAKKDRYSLMDADTQFLLKEVVVFAGGGGFAAFLNHLNERRKAGREDRAQETHDRTEEGKLLLTMQESAAKWIDQQSKRNDELKQQFLDLQSRTNETVALSNTAIAQANAAIAQTQESLTQTREALARLAGTQEEIIQLKEVIREQRDIIKVRDIEMDLLQRANERLEGAVQATATDLQTVAKAGRLPVPMQEVEEEKPDTPHRPLRERTGE